MMIRLPMIALASGLLAGCAMLEPTLPPLPPIAASEYRLGPGDSVRLITFAEDQLTGEFRVNDAGKIALPLAGSIPAAGLTLSELEAEVAATLQRKKLLMHPSVSAEITAYRPVYVMGEVNKPGQYPYQPGMTVVTAVAVAGGFTYRAADTQAIVMRRTQGGVIEGAGNRQSVLQPGDVVTIPERWF